MAYTAQYVILADQVQQIQRGKLNILGTFDRWWIDHFPGVLPPFVVVALLVAEHEDDLGTHRLAVRVRRPNGLVTGEHGQEMRIDPSPGTYGLATIRLIVGMQGLPIYEPGSHQVEILVDGDQRARHPLSIVQGPLPAA